MVKYLDKDHDGTIRIWDSEKDGMFWDTLWDVTNFFHGMWLKRIKDWTVIAGKSTYYVYELDKADAFCAMQQVEIEENYRTKGTWDGY